MLAAGAGMQIVSMVGADLIAGSVAFLVSTVGLIIYLGGFGLLRAWIFLLLLSVCMLPKLAEFMLIAGGARMRGSGNIPEIGGRKISVAEACRGIRYLLLLIFLPLVIGYLAGSRLSLRGVLVAASIPLAIFADAPRDKRTDTSLVRVLVRVGSNGVETAAAKAADFSRMLYPVLKAELPR